MRGMLLAIALCAAVSAPLSLDGRTMVGLEWPWLSRPARAAVSPQQAVYAPLGQDTQRAPAAERDEWGRLAVVLNVPPVDALIDRVWRAVPGLQGWALDVAASQRQTAAAGDGQRHLVWRAVPPARRLQDLPPEPIYRGPSAEKSVCLMFNVSWGEAYVPALLDALHRAGVRATFFLDGDWVDKHPQLAKQIAAAGHAIGSHGRGHPDLRKLSTAQVERNLASTNASLQHILGQTPRVFAPPAGAFDTRTVAMARRLGMFTILWSADTVDWRNPPASTVAARALRGAENGALILMHPTAPTAAALPAILQGLRQAGYVCKTLDDVVREQRAVAPPTVLSKGPLA
ncbi:MAG: polysaccharide deacetylase family protein [Alicyclobacillus sp.]|nr:polysaccharide deacetylase family protein [Alicyclobacillus sp.]